MNSKVVIFFGLIFLIIVGSIVFLYITYEKPKQDDIQANFVNLSISSLENNNFVKTNFVVVINNTIFATGTTTKEGYTLFQIPVNNNIIIYNQNIDDQTYYIYYYQKEISEQLPQRVNLILEKPSDLQITADNKLGLYNNKVTLNITSSSTFKNAILCLKWSVHLLSVSTGFELIKTPEELKSYDKCYDLNRELINSTMQVSVFYTSFGDLTNDFIHVRLADRDLLMNSTKIIDKGGRNLEFDINNNI